MATKTHSRHKRKTFWNSIAGRALIYFVMTVAVVVIVALLVLVISGYRYNSRNGQLIQGGLLQYDSRPSGADVYWNDARLANRTPNKVTVASGEHTLTMKKAGYDSWTKRVRVAPGEILWMNYTRLVPTEKQTDNVAKFTTVSSALPSPDRKSIVIKTEPSTPELSIVSTDADTLRSRSVAIDTEVLTKSESAESQQFTPVSWDQDNRYVLVKHTIGDHQEWLAVDLRGNDGTVNVTTSIGVNIARAEFKLDNSRVLIAQTTNGEIRRLDLGNRSMSGPIVSDVAEFAQFDASTITYVTRLSEQTKQRTAGYYTEGASKPRVLKTYADHGETQLHLSVGKYYGETYVAIAYGTTLDITTGQLLSSGSKDTSALKQVASLTIPGDVTRLGFSSRDARFLYAENATSISTYDLEIGKFATTPIDNADNKGVTWVDREHFATAKHGAAMYDYDGTNKNQITTESIDVPVVISANNKYFYSFATVDAKPVLQRTKLTIE